MPGPRVQTSGAQLSPGQAAYVLERLVADRRISQGEVNRYVAEMGREIKELEARLQRLRSVQGGGTTQATRRRTRGNGATTPARTAAPAPASAPAKRKRRARKLSAEEIASRQLQGRYLSLIRRIPANKRAQYKKLASEKGREAAIKEMKAAVGK